MDSWSHGFPSLQFSTNPTIHYSNMKERAMTDQVVIQVERMRKAYGATVAVEDVSFEVHRGEVFGMVGPNGAGKTTTTECLEGLRAPERGVVRVLGLNPQADGYALRERIGVQLQTSALPERIKVWEALDLFAAFYPHALDTKDLLVQMGLAEKRQAKFGNLSGGQKQRLFIALALLNDPEIVFLDELTTGLDPHARHAMWDMVRGIRGRGKTVFLTTHYMEEAERLCDRVAIMDHGRVVALDSPENLIRQHGGDRRLVFRCDGQLELEHLRQLPKVSHVERVDSDYIVQSSDDDIVFQVTSFLQQRNCRLRDLRTEQATLENVFLNLTGRKMRE